jgi:hypothetical protein
MAQGSKGNWGELSPWALFKNGLAGVQERPTIEDNQGKYNAQQHALNTSGKDLQVTAQAKIKGNPHY